MDRGRDLASTSGKSTFGILTPSRSRIDARIGAFMTEYKPSYTAEGVAAWRAAGAMEKDGRIRNPDYMAVQFLGWKLRLIARFPPLTALALRTYQKRVPGGYYFHIARTKHIDTVLAQAIDDGMQQLVILGAGYDSRPYRFARELQRVNVFEVDQPGTQARKQRLLTKALGELPDHVVFVAMDFNTERLKVRLPESGYDAGRKTLFIWEGVCMYITPEAAHETLSFIAQHSCPGSGLVFDYLYQSVIDGTCDYYGAREAAQFVASRGEPYIFGIEEGRAAEFLDDIGITLVSALSHEELQNAYLIRSDGTLHGRVYGYTDIAYGVAAPRE